MKIYKSEKGFLCVEKDGKNLHSRYNPQKEAERFVKASISNKPSLIILLGSGLGYVQECISTLFPETTLLAVYYDDILHKNNFYRNNYVQNWFPSSNISIHSFFTRFIEERTLNNIAVLEWNPASIIYQDLSLEINNELKNVIQQLNGNIFTTAVFGKKWIRNMICNYLSLDNYCTLDRENAPIVIASSGPTLNQSIKEIKRLRNKFRLWALPSSLKALSHHRIKPDLLLSTDPGFYGSFHFNFLNEDILVALPLTASRGLWKNNNSALILNQSMPFENDLFSLDTLENTKIDSNGTVSGTALELASLKSDLIYFTGLDLCYMDIQSHIKPHSFDDLLSSETYRMNSIHSLIYKRSSTTIADFERGIRTSRSLDTYKNWFNTKSLNQSLQIKRLNPSPVKIDNMKIGYFDEMENYPDLERPRVVREAAESRDDRISKIKVLLEKWEYNLKENNRDDLLYFIDTDSYIKGSGNEKALIFINQLRGIYG